VGDTINGTTTSAVLVGDRVAIPAGSTIQGRVTGVDPATKGLKIAEKGGAIALSFTKVTTPNGDSSAMSGSLTSLAKSKGKTAGIIGGSAAGGAILGKILGGSTKDAAIGAVVGGGIGTGIAAGTKGKEVVIPAGTDLAITLNKPLTIASARNVGNRDGMVILPAMRGVPVVIFLALTGILLRLARDRRRRLATVSGAARKPR
jgi:hypothetical protein